MGQRGVCHCADAGSGHEAPHLDLAVAAARYELAVGAGHNAQAVDRSCVALQRRDVRCRLHVPHIDAAVCSPRDYVFLIWMHGDCAHVIGIGEGDDGIDDGDAPDPGHVDAGGGDDVLPASGEAEVVEVQPRIVLVRSGALKQVKVPHFEAAIATGRGEAAAVLGREGQRIHGPAVALKHVQAANVAQVPHPYVWWCLSWPR